MVNEYSSVSDKSQQLLDGQSLNRVHDRQRINPSYFSDPVFFSSSTVIRSYIQEVDSSLQVNKYVSVVIQVNWLFKEFQFHICTVINSNRWLPGGREEFSFKLKKKHGMLWELVGRGLVLKGTIHPKIIKTYLFF